MDSGRYKCDALDGWKARPHPDEGDDKEGVHPGCNQLWCTHAGWKVPHPGVRNIHRAYTEGIGDTSTDV